MIGATVGTLIFAIILAVVTSSGFPTGTNLLFAFCIGAGWGFGQIITFKALERRSSRAMPVTTAFQLLGTSMGCLCIRKLARHWS
ncbi:GRP family sugar transporter [Staphylococcus aureus]